MIRDLAIVRNQYDATAQWLHAEVREAVRLANIPFIDDHNFDDINDSTHITLILDSDPVRTLTVLEGRNSVQRAHISVFTLSTNHMMHDILGSYHISAVLPMFDHAVADRPTFMMAALYLAATAQKSYTWRSGLTYMELRVLRNLLQEPGTSAEATTNIARMLSISTATVRSHISNIMAKTGHDNREELLDSLRMSYA